MKLKKYYYIVPNNEGINDKTLYNMVNKKGFCDDKLAVNLGNDVFFNLRNAPHLLVSGSTGSGKSVCIDTIILELLIKNSPNDLNLYFVDPKRVDYIEYKSIPHCKGYATELNDVTQLLNSIESEMYKRYNIMQSYNAKKIENVNGCYPQIILIFDEIATFLDSKSKKEILPLINNIARLGRASGIHIIVGCQKPTSDIVSGQLKANIPTRISFRLPSAFDSRVILDEKGAENLKCCGHGIIKRSDGSKSIFNCYMIPKSQKDFILKIWQRQPYKR